MKVLITGGSGFIGANLSERLLGDGHEVFCMDNFYSSNKSNVEDLLSNQNFKLIEHDILNDLPEDVHAMDFDQIYHLACPASPPRYQKDHVYTLRVNFDGTLNMLNFAKDVAARSGKSPRFLFTSTSEVYGDPLEHPQSEEYRGNVNPNGIRSCYDEGKRVAESLVMNFYHAYGLDVKIVRIFNTYGPKMDADDGRVVSNFIIQALNGEDLTIYGDGKQTRSFQYIDDLLNGIISYMELDEDFPGPMNIGTPDEFTILDLAEKVLAVTGLGADLKFCSLPGDDPLQRCPNTALAKQKLGWEAKVPLDEGLKKTIDYFRSQVERQGK